MRMLRIYFFMHKRCTWVRKRSGPQEGMGIRTWNVGSSLFISVSTSLFFLTLDVLPCEVWPPQSSCIICYYPRHMQKPASFCVPQNQSLNGQVPTLVWSIMAPGGRI